MGEPAPYLDALALFDRREWFEAHEVLEDLWRVTEGRDREFYQGLIQLSVVLLHMHRGNATGAANVLDTCRRHLAPYEPEWRGVNVSKILAFCDDLHGKTVLATIQKSAVKVPDTIPRFWNHKKG